VALEEEKAELGFLKKVLFFFDVENEREEDEEEAMVVYILCELNEEVVIIVCEYIKPLVREFLFLVSLGN